MSVSSSGLAFRNFVAPAFKYSLVLSVSVAAVALGAIPARAQASDPQSAPTPEVVEVTGTRVVRDGYQAPTPTTVLGAAELQAAAPVNLADEVNELPALAGSRRMDTSTVSAGLAGLNTLNLRDLGVTRTLILFDGQRMPAATTNGYVDINTIPNALIKRVDIVTGGASAAWGSDAMGGVVNFVLDKDFVGVKGQVAGGITSYGDDPDANASIALGTNFAGGRVHFLLDLEEYYKAGLKGLPRPWYTGAKQLFNPNYTATNGQPQLLAEQHVGYTNVAPGAIVSGGPLNGLYFGPGGVPTMLNFGPIVSSPFMVGGDWKVTDFGNGPQDIDIPLSRQDLFTRLSYVVTDDLQLYAQFSYGRSAAKVASSPQFNFGGLTIQNTDPYLPASIVTAMKNDGITSLNVGSWNKDIGALPFISDHRLYRYVIGATGDLNVFGSNWTWDAFFDHNVSQIFQDLHEPNNARYAAAVNVITGPGGTPVCASYQTNPTCVPLDILGVGTASTGGLNYVEGDAFLHAAIIQDEMAATFNGEPFSTWAGKVSVAAGIEHRRESESGRADPDSATKSWFEGNYSPISGSYDVTEGFVEVVVPLAENSSWAKELDFNSAVRETDYSTSGLVTTWKYGLTYAPVDDIKFRGTASYDIRAGNLSDLYQAGSTLTNAHQDPFENNRTYSMFDSTTGNPKISPETARNIDLGVILQPSFIPGFNASVDYWDIHVTNAIGTLGAQNILDLCHAGTTSVCQFIQRNSAGDVFSITLNPLNLASQYAAGIDLETDYSFGLDDISKDLGGGRISMRALVTRSLANKTNSGVPGSIPTSLLGSYSGVPYWRYLTSMTYTAGPVSATLTARGLSAGLLSPQFIQCTSGCPVSTSNNRTINDNNVNGAYYFDLSLSYEFASGIEPFVVVNDIVNNGAPPAANGTSIGNQQFGVSPEYYDVLGRTFRGGIRFNF
jgi:outer membrane receptor protein involved in Fe transport